MKQQEKRLTVKEIKEDSYTTEEISTFLDLDVTTVRALITRENMAFKIGGKLYVRKYKMEEYIAKILNDAR